MIGWSNVGRRTDGWTDDGNLLKNDYLLFIITILQYYFHTITILFSHIHTSVQITQCNDNTYQLSNPSYILCWVPSLFD